MKKTEKIFRDGPAHWRARRPNFKFPDAIAKGFFLPFLPLAWLSFIAVRLRPGLGGVSGDGSLESVSLSKITFEYINLRHFIKLVGIERFRIDVGGLFREIGIF